MDLASINKNREMKKYEKYEKECKKITASLVEQMSDLGWTVVQAQNYVSRVISEEFNSKVHLSLIDQKLVSELK